MSATAAPMRIGRGSVVATVGLGVAVAGHAYAGGAAVVPPWTWIVAVLIGAACVIASANGWTLARLVAALAGIQVAAHAVLWISGSTHAVDARLTAVAALPGGHAHTSDVTHAAWTPTMLGAHLVAIVVAGALLAGLDRAALVVVALARGLVRRARLASGGPMSRPPRRRTPSAPDVVLGVLMRPVLRHRGPPRVLALR